MGDCQADEKWRSGQETEEQALPKAAIQADFGKGFCEILSQRKSDCHQANKNLQRSLDPFWYIKGMAMVEMAVRGNAYQPCLRFIKKVKHRQNNNGIQQAVAVRLQKETPAAVLDTEVFSPFDVWTTIKKLRGRLRAPFRFDVKSCYFFLLFFFAFFLVAMFLFSLSIFHGCAVLSKKPQLMNV